MLLDLYFSSEPATCNRIKMVVYYRFICVKQQTISISLLFQSLFPPTFVFFDIWNQNFGFSTPKGARIYFDEFKYRKRCHYHHHHHRIHSIEYFQLSPTILTKKYFIVCVSSVFHQSFRGMEKT